MVLASYPQRQRWLAARGLRHQRFQYSTKAMASVGHVKPILQSQSPVLCMMNLTVGVIQAAITCVKKCDWQSNLVVF